MMKKNKRIRINKVMMAWSDGTRVNMPPSVRSQVDDYGKMLTEYLDRVEEGYEMECSASAVARGKSRCYEYEAARYWAQGRHLNALNEMMRAAATVLPDDDVEVEDMQWLDPWENFYWNANVQDFLHYNRRCIGYCKRDPRLSSLYYGSSIERSYHDYLHAIDAWTRD